MCLGHARASGEFFPAKREGPPEKVGFPSRLRVFAICIRKTAFLSSHVLQTRHSLRFFFRQKDRTLLKRLVCLVLLFEFGSYVGHLLSKMFCGHTFRCNFGPGSKYGVSFRRYTTFRVSSRRDCRFWQGRPFLVRPRRGQPLPPGIPGPGPGGFVAFLVSGQPGGLLIYCSRGVLFTGRGYSSIPVSQCVGPVYLQPPFFARIQIGRLPWPFLLVYCRLASR